MRLRLPRELRRWKPKRAALGPATDHEFASLEAARSFGYSWRGWQEEAPRTRARLMAHEIERSLREAYARELEESRAEGKERGKNPAARMKAMWGLE